MRTLGVFHLDSLRGSSLQWLGLGQCGLLHIAEHALSGLSNLTSLTLAYNSLMPGTLASALQGLGNDSRLVQLDLSHMPLRELNPTMLSHFSYLEVSIVPNL